MSNAKNILFVTPRIPLPADTGAKIRTYNLLKFAAQKNRVGLLSLYSDENKEALRKLEEMDIGLHLVKSDDRINPLSIFGKKPMSIAKYYIKEMRDRLRKVTENGDFELVHFDHLHMGQYSDHLPHKRYIIDNHNIESELLRRCAAITRNLAKKLLFRLQAGKMARLELRLSKSNSRFLVVSDDDKKSLHSLSGRGDNIDVIPNGVDIEYFRPPRYPARGFTDDDIVVFTGSMDWLPNIDAVKYFAERVLPHVWEENPSVKFYVVGKNPPGKLYKLGVRDNRIIILGAVNDIRPYISRARVFVAPIRTGGGTRLKILEAMAMEKCVVSTTLGAEGIACTNEENIIIKDEPREFGKAINALLKDGEKRNALGRQARRLVCRMYTWDAIGEKLNNVYEELFETSDVK